jgi:hypothetical protein
VGSDVAEKGIPAFVEDLIAAYLESFVEMKQGASASKRFEGLPCQDESVAWISCHPIKEIKNRRKYPN